VISYYVYGHARGTGKQRTGLDRLGLTAYGGKHIGATGTLPENRVHIYVTFRPRDNDHSIDKPCSDFEKKTIFHVFISID